MKTETSPKICGSKDLFHLDLATFFYSRTRRKGDQYLDTFEKKINV